MEIRLAPKRAWSLVKVIKRANIRNRYHQAPHLTKDTNGKVTNSQLESQTRAKRSALSQQVTTRHQLLFFIDIHYLMRVKHT